MHYVVLAYPKLTKANYDWIQEIRKIHDMQFTIVEPHFTIVFPTSKLDENEFVDNIVKQQANVSPFSFTLTKAVVEENHFPKYFQVHLVADEMVQEIVTLHDVYYVDALASELRLDIPYTPHITIASNADEGIMRKLADEINAKQIKIHGSIDTIVIGSFDGKKVSDVKHISLA